MVSLRKIGLISAAANMEALHEFVLNIMSLKSCAKIQMEICSSEHSTEKLDQAYLFGGSLQIETIAEVEGLNEKERRGQ